MELMLKIHVKLCIPRYCSTKAEVEGVHGFLQGHLGPLGRVVLMYHAGLSHEQRKAAHVAFLTGQFQGRGR